MGDAAAIRRCSAGLLEDELAVESATTMRRCALIVVAAFLVAACDPSRGQLDADNPIVPATPPPFGMEEFFAASHEPDPARARLGRWLFYDTRLSSNGSVSCSTCHRPEFAFSEPEATPIGIRGQRGRRKTPGIINLAARTELPGTANDPGATFFWDGRGPGSPRRSTISETRRRCRCRPPKYFPQ